jgi:cellulose synthase/poly-beta-1,6-N-acetylglucosamine synthase-like glycosyltransferase
MPPPSSSVVAFRPAARSAGPVAAAGAEAPIALDLMRAGLLPAHALIEAMARQARHGGLIEDVLVAGGLADPWTVAARLAQRAGVGTADPLAAPPDPDLVDRLGAASCLRDGLLPWRAAGRETIVLASHPRRFERHRRRLEALFGPVRLALAPSAAIEAAVTDLRGADMAEAAETRVAERDSCRRIGTDRIPAILGACFGALAVFTVAYPLAVLVAVTLWAAITLAAASVLKLGALLASLRRQVEVPAPPVLATPPMVSVLVPLYREAAVATRLVRRLERLDYPRDRLEVVLVAEADDALTQATLRAADLPVWMRVAVVPPGTVRTKPRALNYALDLCRGAIVGVYDAEDAPAPDQIRRVVARFAARPAEVACLQGVLDYDNACTNWLSRCFTLEYAGWFRVLLPGIARLGLPVPLGGTTLFFRRVALESLGGWDAHNVTEDADLGIRLARRGLRTELIDTVTMEEAACRALPWVKQRSRWIKGYMMTWAVHMRHPLRLWRELGIIGFLGFQTLFLAALSQFLLAPVLWSFWVMPFGLPHPVAAVLPPAVVAGLVGLFLLTELVNLAVAWSGLRRRGGGVGALWCLTLPLYFPLAVFAAYKGLWEMARKPFFWDKTAHGSARSGRGSA